MRAVVITSPGGPEVLNLEEVPDPVPGEGEVVVEVVAAGVNPADLLQRQGFYPPPPGAPAYPGLECSGRIARVGPGVSGWHEATVSVRCWPAAVTPNWWPCPLASCCQSPAG